MEYNSSRELLIIPEYGRHVQKMVRYAKTIEDDDERQAYAEHVAKLMMQMHPQNRNLEDYRDKIWKHLFRIAEYELDVLPPNGHKPTPEGGRKKPNRVPYPAKGHKFRHYGHNVLTLIDKALSMEEGPKKDGFVQVIGSYMKLAYKTWNREHYVSDHIIIEDLATLSDDKLVPVEDASLDNLSKYTNRRSSNSVGGSKGGRPRDNNGHYRSGGKNNNRRGGGGGRRNSGGGRRK